MYVFMKGEVFNIMERFMNEPLKFKYHSLYGQILQDRKLTEAWKQVKENNGSGGIDGVSIKDFEEHEQENISRILNELKRKEYKPTPVRRVYIPKKDGKKRPLGIPTIKDRIVQQTAYNILSPIYEEKVFHQWSFGYRPNRSVSDVLTVIIRNIEKGRNWIYDCDIKGFFDNIPHKNLMKVLNKVIADGTVLDLIWSWLKSGYMEEGKYYDTEQGSPQGGVISPLLANIYLNELDWELHKKKIYFVRYADDFLLFAETEEEINRAGEVARSVIESLGLEIAMNKTKIINFKNDDFDFLGFHFKHWIRDKNGDESYAIRPSDKSIKDYRKKIKDITQRKYTLSRDEWVNRLNPIIRGKVNYYLNVWKAVKIFLDGGYQPHCSFLVMDRVLENMDGYTRQRLRMCMLHKHPTVRKAMGMKVKWNNAFFVSIKLIPCLQHFYSVVNGLTPEGYIQYISQKNKAKNKAQKEHYKKLGINYFTDDRVRKIAYAMSK